MNLNDFSYFAAVAQHGGFTAAARATGIDKARLSRCVASLEENLGVRLLNRSTRSISLTDAGQRFYHGCQAVLGSARAAMESIAELQKEPAGIVRIGCSVVLAQNYLAPILPHYLATHPKVTVVVEHGDRWINPLDSDLDLALTTMVEALPGSSLVAREIGRVRRILVTGRTSAGHVFAPDHPDILAHLPLIARIEDMHDGEVRWALTTDDGRDARVAAQPRLVTNDQNVQFEAAASGAGIALLPESVVASALDDGTLVHVLPEWSTPEYSLHLVYPLPRGILPSVRSFIDFLASHLWPIGRRSTHAHHAD
ncbi:LysR family transcriptional regulator [Novosphingobium nitrogenifigens DSM 19370]|uniref:LysR family transcriptional regulator n=1 Tax=Novosphingobium nitrogenifigens DSM 19370 TaxID=983920 RepID=F1Z9N0_9SPHN|nr:LysR substrate-binding domain-containing protein [Novosphingobium nitrogenifigens]EGD58712.1 LysR family transcriptional regulator [Novosphingobium nitrogenifigens DSM 19370]